MWFEPAIQSTTGHWSAVNFKKIELGKVQLEPATWLRVAGQRITCFDRCQMTRTLMSNIKDVCCKLTELPAKRLRKSRKSRKAREKTGDDK